jgi:aminopeptidase N
MGQPEPGIRLAALSLALGSLVACQSMVTPLDPVIGDTGQALSVLAQAADVKTYELDLDIDMARHSFRGVGRTGFVLLQPAAQLELKLDSRYRIDRIEVDGQAAVYERTGGVLTIALGAEQPLGSAIEVAVFYRGRPHAAKSAPWDGGTVWAKTTDGKAWMATAVQAEGCDLLWPCKDHFADKADSMRIRLTVPNGLSAVTNGVLQQVTAVGSDKQQFDWLLSVPASDNNIALNVGPYQRIQTSYTSINGSEVPVEFWALPENADKARTLWQQDLLQQVQWYEQVLGPHPWGNQKLGFVETPHLGMEHQTLNHAWLHEGFGLYMQPAYARDKLGIAAYHYQLYKSYLGLLNCDPVVRTGNVSSEEAFSSDIYGKGSWTLHTLRYLVGEAVFWQAARELLYRTVGELRTLAWKVPANKAFPMPVPVVLNGQPTVLDFSTGPVQLKASDQLLIDPDMQILRQLPLIGLCEENRKQAND